MYERGHIHAHIMDDKPRLWEMWNACTSDIIRVVKETKSELTKFPPSQRGAEGVGWRLVWVYRDWREVVVLMRSIQATFQHLVAAVDEAGKVAAVHNVIRHLLLTDKFIYTGKFSLELLQSPQWLDSLSLSKQRKYLGSKITPAVMLPQ